MSSDVDKLERITGLLNSLSRRLDRVAAREDAARADAVAEARVHRARQDRDRLARVQLDCTEFQARCDDAMSAYGVRAPSPVAGEDETGYKRRLLELVQERLPSTNALYRVPLGTMRADALEIIGEQILTAAKAMAFDPESVPRGVKVARSDNDTYSGLKVTRWVGGDEAHFIRDLTRPGRRLARLVDPKSGRVLIGPPETRLLTTLN
jgi:hypothetical protein